jgi:hypothetical protein
MKVSTEIDNNFGYEKITQLKVICEPNVSKRRRINNFCIRNRFSLMKTTCLNRLSRYFHDNHWKHARRHPMGTNCFIATTYFRILQQLSCGTRSNVSFVSNPAQISLKHSSQLTNKTTLATSFVFIRHVFHCVLHVCLCFHIVGKLAKKCSLMIPLALPMIHMYGVPIWSLWPNTRFLPSIVVEKNVLQNIFRHIFLSNYWWQKSDIWSQASHRYAISWEAFLEPCFFQTPQKSYFLIFRRSANLIKTRWTVI